MTAAFANPVGLMTIVRRELLRTLKVVNQVIWPPVITTALYVLVFGLGLGSRIRTIDGVPYSAFLIPGLIMLQVISQTYDEVASSFFQGRFLNSIQEVLIAPLSSAEIVVGFVIASIIRALGLALLMVVVGFGLAQTLPQNWGLFVLVTVIVAVIFAALGLVMGTLGEKFEHIAIPTTFIITPLVFVGGVFTSLKILPPFVQKISLFNPMVYMIDAFRYSFTGRGDVSLGLSLAVISALAALSLAGAFALASTGYKLRI